MIGETNDIRLFLSNYDAVVREEVKTMNMMYKMGFPTVKSSITEKQYIDGRKGMISKFTYCPHCGNKIKWKELNKNI